MYIQNICIYKYIYMYNIKCIEILRNEERWRRGRIVNIQFCLESLQVSETLIKIF